MSGPPAPVREYQLTLYADPSDQYGFGLRVVAATTGERQIPCARVLWTCPGGAADAAGVRVGDKVGGWGGDNWQAAEKETRST